MINLDKQQREQLISDIMRRDLQEDFHAGDLLGYDPEEYQRIISSGQENLLTIASQLGFPVIRSEIAGSRELILARPGNVDKINRGVVGRIIEILTAITPDNSCLLLAFSTAPNSALFRPLQELDCGLALLINPQGRGFASAPGGDWQEIAGGWKKGTLIAPARSFFLTADNPSGRRELAGQMKLTAGGQRQIIDQLRALTTEHWPLAGHLSAADQAERDARETLRQIDELIADYRHYRAECQQEIADLRYELEGSREDWDYQQEDLQDLRASLQRAEAEAQRLAAEISDQEQELRAKENYLPLDLRHKFLSTVQLTEQLAQIENLPGVTAANIIEPFGLDHYSGQLAIEAEIVSGQPCRIVAGADQVTVNNHPHPQIESRSLALAEKFAAGRWVELSRMILALLRS